ncbi:DUF2231 domain-containing protein [Polymorphospora sp. NPDC051019]|uniref:DUF2231 domain-containing protein n=1 Tax=Polymorphospora sp. NPDC051019 TaxID=3155725 RepID=UPI0034349385
MFDEFMGLPAHPLLVHAAVVFVPLLAVVGIVYGFVPRARTRIGWAAVLLAVAAPVSALFSKISGEALEERLITAGYGQEILDKVNEHQAYGDLTFWFSLALAIAIGALVFLTTRGERGPHVPAWVPTVLAVLVTIFGVVTMIYVYLTGETGAQAVWSGVV